jgi:hypothetical protein
MNDTKLLACAGSGKTAVIIFRIDHLIKYYKINKSQILMLTFSRFTRDDFINKISKYEIDSIDKLSVKTIDSFAKNIIDTDNEIDVSLLSYKFMKYLESASKDDLSKNEYLSNIIHVFVDESQDLNEIQYNILIYLKEKNGTNIHLIGDSNQNIYQFRNSSDKYLSNYKAKTFMLTKNFRSHDSIIDFCRYLRPDSTIDITGNLGKNDCLPSIIFHEDDTELESYIKIILKNAKKEGLDYSDFAILAPTRGRMRGHGRSHGLCFISNLLYKNNIKFKQFYEEAMEDFSGNITYKPVKGHVNVLTYMGSKGLEWKYVILIDADMCLINKRHFTNDKHKNDQYLLYVACSRAINNIIIFSKYKNHEGNLNFYLNPWFSLIPTIYYKSDERFDKYFKFQQIKEHDLMENEKRIIKIIDKMDEKMLDDMATICKFGVTGSVTNKTIKKIFDKDFSTVISSNVFLGKYIKNLFFIYYQLAHGIEKKRYMDIENIINAKHIITDVPVIVSDWFYINRNYITWEYFDKISDTLDKVIKDTINKKFNRTQKLQDHTIVNDGYFKSFILSMEKNIKKNYEKYIKTCNPLKIRKYLFHILITIYSLETQHYFHTLNKGKKFKNLIFNNHEYLNNIQKFAYSTKMIIIDNNITVTKNNIIGEIDLLEFSVDKIIWEVKCVQDITLKHVLQVVMYNIFFYELDNIKTNRKINISANFINLLKGEIIKYNIELTRDEITKIINNFLLISKKK